MQDPDRSLESDLQIDAICDRFESNWRSGQRPEVADVLDGVPENTRGALLRELISVEVQLRRQDGEAPEPEEYGIRFPDDRQAVAEGFALAEGESAEDSDPVVSNPEQGDETRIPPGQDPAWRERTETKPPPRQFGRFEVLEALGEGAFGTVWKAHDTVLKRLVALKIPRHGPVCSRQAAFFLDEARAAARLKHPGVVHVYDVGEEDGAVYIASEYIEGRSLREFLDGQRISFRETARICLRIADALAYAHEMDIVHRDLKPANVLVDNAGTPYLTDFGLAWYGLDESPPRDDRQFAGTLPYMSPEQVSGKALKPDGRSDIFSFGIILFEMLTVRGPFQGEGEELAKAIGEAIPPRPRRLVPKLPRDLEAICLKCLEKRPERRYQKAGELAEDLRRFLDGLPVRARPASAPGRFFRWARRRPATAVMVLATLGLTVTLISGGVIHSVRTTQLLRAAEEELYYQRISAASVSWQANDIGQFNTLLEDCPARLRDRWEWGYLKGLPSSAAIVFQHASGAVAYSPDGTLLATGLGDKGVQLWRSGGGRLPLGMGGQDGSVDCLAFSPDNTRLVSAGRDGSSIFVWDVKRGQKLQTFSGHTERVAGIRFFPDSRRIASASWDKSVRVWDAESGRELLRLPHPGRVWSLDISPDGKRIVSACGREDQCTIHLWDSATGNRLRELPSRGGRTALAFSPDGRLLGMADRLGLLRILDASSLCETLVIPAAAGGQPLIAFHPSGGRIAASQADGTVRVWDAVSGRELTAFRGQTKRVEALAFRPDGSQIAFATMRDGVFVFDADVEPGSILLRHPRGEVLSFAFAATGDTLVSGGSDGSVHVWDVNRKSDRLLSAEGSSPTRCVAYSDDGHWIAAGGDDALVRVWDAATDRLVLRFDGHSGPVQTLAFTPDGSRIASAGRDQAVMLWEIETGRVVHSLADRCRDIRSVAVSPCGRWIAATGRRRVVEVWESETGSLRFSERLPSPGYGVTFSPDGETIAVSTSNGATTFWRFQTGEKRTLFVKETEHRRGGLAFSPDGLHFVSSVESDAVRLWDRERNRELLALQQGAHVSGIVAFSPCGRRIAAVSKGGRIQIWSSQVSASPPNQLDSRPTAGERVTISP